MPTIQKSPEEVKKEEKCCMCEKSVQVMAVRDYFSMKGYCSVDCFLGDSSRKGSKQIKNAGMKSF